MVIEQSLWDEMGYSNHLTGGFIPSGKRLHNYGKSPFLMGEIP